MVITLPIMVVETGETRARLEDKLEREYEGHTERLASLLTRKTRQRGRHATPDIDAAVIVARRALAEVAAALRRMAEGSYGRCERCEGDIPLAHLEAQPSARFCPGCHLEPLF